MKSMKDFLRKLFLYEEPNSYSFILPENSDKKALIELEELTPDSSNLVSKMLKENIDFLTVKLNALVSSDIIFRNFTISYCGRSYNAFLVGIDGMVNSDMINNFLLKPLMISSRMLKKSSKILNPNIKTNPKLNLEDYLFDKLIPQTNTKKEKQFDYEELYRGPIKNVYLSNAEDRNSVMLLK